MIAVAARVADAWNGWAMDAEGFEEAAARAPRRSPTVAPVFPDVGRDRPRRQRSRPTWNGSVKRAGHRGLSMDVWQGDATAFRGFAERLEEAGCSWIVVLPVGGEDRIEVVAVPCEPEHSGAGGRG